MLQLLCLITKRKLSGLLWDFYQILVRRKAIPKFWLQDFYGVYAPRDKK